LNVVFDLGGVLLTCDPPALVSSLFDDPAEQALILDGVFGDPDWVEFDRGAITRRVAVDRAVKRMGVDRHRLNVLFDALPGALVPVQEVVELVRALKTAGNRVFALSNMHPMSLAHLESRYDFFALFEGRVISCEVGLCKPELGIYTRLLESFGLDPNETVFIDDVPANLEAAAQLGIRTIRFTSVETCSAELSNVGCSQTLT
jgi:putative hydrolase of the HAD superfamily